MTTSEAGWVKLDEDDNGWYCEGEKCPTESEPNAIWAFRPYEDQKANEPAYLCDPCYENYMKENNA